MTTRVFPDDYKKANVTPNYSPASLTSVPGQFFPKPISSHIREKMAEETASSFVENDIVDQWEVE